MTDEKREPLATLIRNYELNETELCVAGESVADDGRYGFSQDDLVEKAEKINAAHEARVKEEVAKAVAKFKMVVAEQMDILEKSAMNCPSCGFLYPDHGGRCGLYVSRDAVEDFKNRALIAMRGVSVSDSCCDCCLDEAYKVLKSLPTESGGKI